MDNNNWRPAAPGADATVDSVDWRTQLQPDARQRIVDKIMETLKKHLPCSVHEGLQELRGIAVRFEEKIYTAAVSQPDYLRKISLKMLTMENKSPTTISNAGPGSNSVGSSRISDSASIGMSSQVQSQVQAHPQSQSHQPMVPQSVPNSMTQSVVQNSNGIAYSLAPVPNMAQSQMSNVVGLTNNNIQNMSGITQNPAGNQLGQPVQPNSFSNSQRQMAGRQQVVQQQPGQPQNSQYLYQQQLQQQLMKSKFPHGNHSQPLMQSHVQQQQNMQQSVGQQSSVMQQSMMQSSSMVGLQQNQPSSVQQQQVSRQQQHPSMIHQQQSQMMKQQLLGQQTNSSSMQQNPMIGQQNGMGELQQQRLLQQNGLQNLQQPQQMLSQQSSMHTQQMSSQNNATLQQQQQLLGAQSSNPTMPSNQQTAHMLQKKIAMQQQHNGSTLINSQVQQPQSQMPQPQLMQMQPSATPLQQHLTMQQQPNTMPRDLQQRIQGQGQGLPTNNIMQSQSIMNQKQIYQNQRTIPDSTSSLDPASQSGQVNVGDWQEETYQKIKQMKEAYMVELSEMYQKLSVKIQHNDSLPQPQSKSDNNGKLKVIKQMVERLMHVLQLSKSDISPAIKDKLDVYEKQIMSILANNRPRKPMPTLQSHVQTIQQPHDNNVNSQLQPMNMQGHSSALPIPANMPSMHHNSMPSISGISPAQQNMMNPMQPMDSSHGNSMGSLQPTQQSSVMTLPSLQQNSVNMLQPNSNLLTHQQQMKQHQEQQMKQQFQQRQVQHLMQKQQQLHQQAKQQMASPQMSQLHHMNDANDIKVRPAIKPNSFQQPPSSNQRASYPHQQMKSGNSFSMSSPQLLQVISPQIQQHSSPQVEQQTVLSSLPKPGTPLQSATSPFVVPSPSTPLAPSPMPGDTEKQVASSLINTAHQQTHSVPAHPPGSSMAVGTPGISASPLLTEFAGAENVGGAMVTTSKPNSVEQPIERLLKAVKSLSPKALSSAVNDIGSVVTMIDRIAGSAPGNGSRAAVGEDLVAMTKCCLQARNCTTQEGIGGTRKMKRYTSAMPLNVASSIGSFSDSFKQMNGSEASELESTATSKAKKPRIESNHALIEEIRYINRRLIDTEVEISDENVDPTAVIATAEDGEGTVVKCIFTAIALSPNLRRQYASTKFWSPIHPLRLLVPPSYPNCSPILLDKLSPEAKNSEDLGTKARWRLSVHLRRVAQPMSVGEIAKRWGMCARSVISEQTQPMGGGTFTSKYGSWEQCLTSS